MGRRSVRFAIVLTALLAQFGVGAPGATATGPDTVDFTLIDRAAGPVRAVAVQDHYAFVGIGHKLVVFDVLSGRKPQRVSETRALAANVEAVAVTGHFAYVAAGAAGLFIYDVASPEAPVLVGSLATPAAATDVAVDGRDAYVTTLAAGLRIVDIGDAAAPVEIGSFDDQEFDAVGVAVAGAFAFVTTSPSGLQVLDVADPSRPTEVGSTTLAGTARGIAVEGRYAYVAAGDAGLRIIDVANPREPREIGSSTKRMPEDAYDVAVAAGRAYVADRSVSDYDEEFYPGGLRVVDVSSPTRPRQLGALKGDLLSVGLLGRRAYVAEFGQPTPDGRLGDGSFDVVSVKTPAHPRRIASVSIPPRISAPLAADGMRLYTTDDRLRQFDVSDPEHPRLAWSLPLSTDTYYKGQLPGLAVGGSRAYVGGGTAGLHVVDLTNPESPQLVATLSVEAYALALGENVVFVAELYGGLLLVDVTNPASPRVVGRISGEWSVTDMQAVGDFLYVVNYGYPENSALLIYDVRNPAQPALVGSFAIADPASPRNVDVAGGYAYLAIDRIEETALVVVDISDPTAPRSVADIAATPNPTSDMALSGTSVYLTVPAIPGGGLRVVDVSDPGHPRAGGAFPMSAEFATAVTPLPGGVVALGGSEGLLVLRQTVR